MKPVFAPSSFRDAPGLDAARRPRAWGRGCVRGPGCSRSPGGSGIPGCPAPPAPGGMGRRCRSRDEAKKQEENGFLRAAEGEMCPTRPGEPVPAGRGSGTAPGPPEEAVAGGGCVRRARCPMPGDSPRKAPAGCGSVSAGQSGLVSTGEEPQSCSTQRCLPAP